jgi:ElaB/YqjD/DUF883 family membrane-anchored ribosome-binding protein
METNAGEFQETPPVSREKLAEDLRILTRDAEEFLKATAGELGNKLSEQSKTARAQLEEALNNAKSTYRSVHERTWERARATDQTVRSHPYESIGIGFAVGLLMGLLVSKR